MNSEEFEMFLNFTKLLTNMGKQLASIEEAMRGIGTSRFVIDSIPPSKEVREFWQELEKANAEGEVKDSQDTTPNIEDVPDYGIPFTHPEHPDYVLPNVAGRKPRCRANDFQYAPLVKRIDALLKKETIMYERKYTVRGPNNYGVRYFNAWPFKYEKDNAYKIAFLIQDVCAFISKLSGVEDVYIHTNPRTSKRSIVVKFTKKEKVT